MKIIGLIIHLYYFDLHVCVCIWYVHMYTGVGMIL